MRSTEHEQRVIEESLHPQVVNWLRWYLMAHPPPAPNRLRVIRDRLKQSLPRHPAWPPQLAWWLAPEEDQVAQALAASGNPQEQMQLLAQMCVLRQQRLAQTEVIVTPHCPAEA
jgi:hypothetical protein